MGTITKIQWTDHTLNPWRGCGKVHTGCAHCYAESQSGRNPLMLGIWGDAGTRILAADKMWSEPIKWNRCAILRCDVCGHEAFTEPAPGTYDPLSLSWDFECPCCVNCTTYTSRHPRVFCASLADIFEDWSGQVRNHLGQPLWLTKNGNVEAQAMPGHSDGIFWESGSIPLRLSHLRLRLFDLIDKTPYLDWLLLTKRPENIQKMWPDYFPGGYIAEAGSMNQTGPRRNVWLGTSISDQATANKAVPELLRCRDLAPVRFISAEPLVGPIDLEDALPSEDQVALRRGHRCELDWVIVGGESGPKARPCRPEWVRSLVRQCQLFEVPVFVKQMGANVITRNDAIEDEFNNGVSGWPDPQVQHDIHGFREEFQGADCRIKLRDRKGGDPDEWPQDLRVRQFPEVQHD